MTFLRLTLSVSALVCQCFFLLSTCLAHPASGIVVDAQGHVIFIYTNRGVMRMEASGGLTNIHAAAHGGHWLALDAEGSFSHARPREFERVTPDGAIPALIFASGGAFLFRVRREPPPASTG